MTASSHVLRTLSVLAFLTLLLPCARAWSNGGYSADPDNPDYGTHDWIADMALTLQTRDATFLTTTYHSLFLLGTEAPDNPQYIGDSTNHHVYFHASGLIQDDISAARASQIYQIALGYLLEGDKQSAAYDIGALSHYVSDPGVFGHTMGAYTDWGAETHHSDYENVVESMTGSLSPPTGMSLGDSDAYNATLDLAKNITFGEGAIKSNVWMDTNYDWSDATFAASAMSSLHESVAAVAAVINHLLIETVSLLPPQPSPTPQVPHPPATLTVSVQGSQVILTWTPPADNGGASITSYAIYRGTDLGSPTHVITISGDTYVWKDESVERGRTYHYWVVAENSVGPSDMTRTASATVPKDSGSLVLPIVLSAISGIFASGGLLLWRRKARGTPRP
jgi:hypothetical protein